MWGEWKLREWAWASDEWPAELSRIAMVNLDVDTGCCVVVGEDY